MIPKYKAWDKKTNLMNDVTVIDLEGEIVFCYHWRLGHSKAINFSDIELLQSTGLFDKNGKEIFEGDIVKFKNPYDKRFSAIGVVVWREDKACFGIDMEGTTEQFEVYRITAQNYLTVIGNIHQDERLLGEE